MNLSIYFLMLLLGVLTAEGQNAGPPAPKKKNCVALDAEETDLQLLPGCTMRGVMDKMMNQMWKFVAKYPYSDYELCSNETKTLLTNLMLSGIGCMAKNCSDNTLYYLLEMIDSDLRMEIDATPDIVGTLTPFVDSTIDEFGLSALYMMLCPSAEGGGVAPMVTFYRTASKMANMLMNGELMSKTELVGSMLFGSLSGGKRTCKDVRDHMDEVNSDIERTQSVLLRALSGFPSVTVLLNTAIARLQHHVKHAQEKLTQRLEGELCTLIDS